MRTGRVCILMMDSLGIGASEDANRYGDEKANTLGHILERYPALKIPNLTRWGLLHALQDSSGMDFIPKEVKPRRVMAMQSKIVMVKIPRVDTGS